MQVHRVNLSALQARISVRVSPHVFRKGLYRQAAALQVLGRAGIPCPQIQLSIANTWHFQFAPSACDAVAPYDCVAVTSC